MSITKNLEIISLIYKSVPYLKSIITQLKSSYCKVDEWDIGIRIVANDATAEVLEYLNSADISYTVYTDINPSEYYLNRVYRAWNYSAITSKYDNICFVNSDMVFSKTWLTNLIQYHDGINIPCSRLVESGKMPSGKHGISMNFGRHPSQINQYSWIQYTDYMNTIEGGIGEGGLYMPCILEKQRFIESGMYPEGNVYQQGIGAYNPGHSGLLKSGDDYFFNDILGKKYGMKHITVFNSLVYHIQEGEMDE